MAQDITALEKKVAQGDDSAMVDLGNVYEWGKGVQKDPSKALEYYQQAIKKKNHDAACNFARIHIEGKTGSPDGKKGATQLAEAITWGSGRAAYMLGFYHYYGKYLKEDNDKAFKCFQIAAERQHPTGTAYLADCYSGGYGTEREFKTSVKYWVTAAKLGDNWAAGKAAYYYYRGTHVEKDTSMARKLFHRAIAAEEYSALFGCREFLKNESKDVKEIELMMVLIKKGVKLGRQEAISALGHCYEIGLGVPKSPTKAAHYLKKNADIEGEPMFYNGVVHSLTRQTPPMWKEAIPYYEDYYKLEPNVIVCVQVAEAFIKGSVTGKPDKEGALKWYQRAFEISKNEKHQKRIEQIKKLKPGETIKPSSTAFALMLKSSLAKTKKNAEAGKPTSTLIYASTVCSRYPTKVNFEEIAQLLKNVADKDADCAFLLAELYERKLIPNGDVSQALVYYKKSLALGKIEAHWKVNQLER